MEVRDAELDAEQRFWKLFPKYDGMAIDPRGRKDRHGNILVLCHAFQSNTDDAIAGDVAVYIYHPIIGPPQTLYVTPSPGAD